jgi:hypothetical protein
MKGVVAGLFNPIRGCDFPWFGLTADFIGGYSLNPFGIRRQAQVFLYVLVLAHPERFNLDTQHVMKGVVPFCSTRFGVVIFLGSVDRRFDRRLFKTNPFGIRKRERLFVLYENLEGI